VSDVKRHARGVARGLVLCLSLAAPLHAALGADAEDVAWDKTLEKIAGSVVTIEIDQTRAFDTEWNMSSQATGFVVDAEQGLILTNRHVVTPGPVVATAVFQNREEVELRAVYRDPVHDFGFYRYDPAKLRYIEPLALPLYPEGAKVGTDVRVVGNDAGEQLSILTGTLARLDRQAPDYGIGKYNDFNTFYIQAASGTSGGSSGSPVIDIRGRVVALNAGGSTGAASSFYLPLNRVKRALDLIREGAPVTRGTIQTVFEYTPYDELVRLGLLPETEAQAREVAPELTGMLVVREVQPGSLAESALQPGDILTRVNGKFVTTFRPLDEILDASIGQPLAFEIQRGGVVLHPSVLVEDLQLITPAEYLEFGDGVLHTLSYQMARHLNSPVRGVYVANPGYIFAAAGVPRGAVITSVDGKPVDALADFEQAVATLPQGGRALLRYFTLDDPQGTQTRLVRIDRSWFPARHCHRNDSLGTWPCRDLPEPPPAQPEEPARTTFVATGDAMADRIAPSLVFVTFDMPFSVAGVTERNYHGTGVVVDADRGFVIVDRNTVPVSIGDVRLTFAGSIEVPGKVEYVHPLHNLAIVSYDPALLDGTPIRSARFDTRELRAGEPVTVVGLSEDSRVRSQSTNVASIDAISFPLSRTLQFRDSNIEVASLVNPPTDFDGVVVDPTGGIRALWSSFATENARDTVQVNRGMPADVVVEAFNTARNRTSLKSLEVELRPVPLSAARKLGLTQDWVEKLEKHDPARRQVLSIVRLVAGSHASTVLQEGDLLLAIDDSATNRFREVERAVQRKDHVSVTVWRSGRIEKLEVATASLNGRDLDRLLLWAGAVLHAPHRAMAVQRGIQPDGVFVAYFSYGSPATRYQLFAGRRIVEVDGRPTPNLDAFISAVEGRGDRAALRLKTVTWNGSVEVITLKLDHAYWPAYELRRTTDGWTRRSIG
jgi:S1-C subfamily serine protease